ncbi:hypothetical protein GCM10022267_88800 [Lentzea roselyniae]|uniref:Uncharacterized protein n=1 Tax=Lentzea roselyniae TaxID=531940 RepID=A0ABP7CH63_9PSEU
MIVADGVDELPVHLQAAALGGPAKMAAGCCHWLRSVRLNYRLPADVFRDPAVNRAIGGSRESAAPRLCLLEPRRAARPAPRKLEACGTDPRYRDVSPRDRRNGVQEISLSVFACARLG